MRTPTACLLAIAAFFACPSSTRAELATEAEALTAAENWIKVILNKKESWGGQLSAQVSRMERFIREGRTLGYLFYVQPRGFILVSVCKELPPVKAYSDRSTLDPRCHVGLTALIGQRMKAAIEYIEQQTGKPIEEVSRQDWQGVTETDYYAVWMQFADPAFDATRFRPRDRSTKGMDYQEGDVLLTSHWEQEPPYNDQCPDLGCSWPNHNYYNTNALVGCVATAGVQIFRYWSWPPCSSTGEYIDAYRWDHMPDQVDIYSPPDAIDCCAAASYNIALAVDMDFGCEGSSADTADMEAVFEARRYGAISVFWREDYGSASQWFDALKTQLNQNRPLQYRIEGHSIVADGWQEIDLGGGNILKQYHMNYGWGAGDDTWYNLGELPHGGVEEEYALFYIRPWIAFGDTVTGYWPAEWSGGPHFDKPRRYFARDVTVADAEFQEGQTFQYIRPGFWLHHGPSGAPAADFHGAPTDHSQIQCGGPDGDVRIRILDGTLRLLNEGEIVFR